MINGISLNNRSNVSFGLQMGEETPRPTKKENSDTFTTSKPKHAKQAPKSNGWAPWQKAVAVLGSFGVGATAGAVGTAAVINNQQVEDAPYVLEGHITDEKQLAYVSSLFGSAPEVILDYNGVEDVEALADKDDVAVPDKFTGLEETLADIEAKLASDDIDYDERLVLEKKAEAIKDFESEQENYAVAYKKDDMVYFVIKKDVNVETFKKMYGIKDGVMSDYNHFDGFYDSTDHGMDTEHYINYTAETLQEGETYKVPESAINLAKQFAKLFKENGFDFNAVISAK